MSLRDLKTESDLDAVLRAPQAVLLKHGASCPISAAARKEIAAFAGDRPDVDVYGIEVTGHRALSDAAADKLDVPHASPQAFVLRDGRVVWYAEHFEITSDAVAASLE